MTQSTQFDVGTVAARYIELRDEKEQRAAEHKAEIEVIEEKMSACAEFLDEHLREAGATSMRTPSGTVMRTLKRQYQMRDSGEFLQHIRESGQIELLQVRLSTTTIREYETAENTLPPGVGVEETQTISVRRS
jgi:hypothetical protein